MKQLQPSNTPQLIVGCVVAIVAIAAITALEMTGHEYGMVITIAGPVVAALLVNSHVSALTDQQNEKIGKIESQTNGVLDRRIEDGVSRALIKAGALQPTGSIPAEPAAEFDPWQPATPPTETLGRHYSQTGG